jgi:RNA polymerase sigma-70 factor (ECF subfamily)
MAATLDPRTQFPSLYEQEYDSVYRCVRAIVLDASAAEDLTQETFIRAYRSRNGYRPSAPAAAWLHRIAVNTAISYLRRQKLARLLPQKLFMPNGGGEYERSDARSLVETALEELSPKLRAAVVLHFYHGYNRDEVAGMLGLPSGTVASRMAKAMTVMRRKLSGSDQLPQLVRSGSEGVSRG